MERQKTINKANEILKKYGLGAKNSTKEIQEELQKIIEYNNKIIIEKRKQIKELLDEL